MIEYNPFFTTTQGLINQIPVRKTNVSDFFNKYDFSQEPESIISYSPWIKKMAPLGREMPSIMHEDYIKSIDKEMIYGNTLPSSQQVMPILRQSGRSQFSPELTDEQKMRRNWMLMLRDEMSEGNPNEIDDELKLYRTRKTL